MNGNKKMSSIARKINISFWLKRVGDVIAVDMLLIVLAVGMFISNCHSKVPENAHIEETNASFDTDKIDLKYKIYYDKGEPEIWYFSDYAEPVIFPASILLGCQIIHLFFALFNTHIVRRKMRSLNDLAVRAQEISAATFDTSKFESLEQAISRAHADSPDVKIQTGDSDLQSIEIALNNLLKKMKDSERQQTRFVSDASHELRTPISVIQGYVNMLDRWGKEDEEVLEEAIEALKNESEHMKELIEQLLFLARGDSGRNSLHIAEFDMNEVVKEVWEESIMIDDKHSYNLLFMGEKVAFDEEGTPLFAGPCSMKGDMAMIKQSIRIFVQNAAKYSDENSIINIGVVRKNGKIGYVVQDEGVGMKSDEVVHIFERFYRSDEARNSETGGSGLGLSIAKWIIDAHEGTIDVLSRADIGTRFTVMF